MIQKLGHSCCFRSKPIWEILKRWNRWKPVSNHLRTQLELIIEKPREEIEGKVIPVPESNYKVNLMILGMFTLRIS